MKSLKISQYIISILVLFSIYHAYQKHQKADQARSNLVASLLKEIERKDQIITNLNMQLTMLDEPIFDQTESFLLTLQTDIDDGLSSNSNNKSTTATIAKVAEISNELTSLSQKLDKKNTVLKNLSRVTPFSNIDLTDENLDDYFVRMVEITEGSQYNSEYLANPDKYGKIAFDISDTNSAENNEIFSSEQRRLYAHFELQGYAYDQVLIKWYKQGVTDPIELNYFTINQFGNTNFAWVEPDSNWEPGRYFVEIFSASESPELLSAGSYLVEY